jgi:anti-sigma B factor antagonist
MRIERSQENHVTVVALEGVIKLGESGRVFSEYLGRLLGEDVPAVLLDMKRIDSVDSTGLGELVGYLQRFSEQGRRLALLSPPERIMNLLRLTRLDEVFTIYTDRTTAVRDLGEA